jgi:hypothetical protein
MRSKSQQGVASSPTGWPRNRVKGALSMCKLRLNVSMSLDGFVAGPERARSPRRRRGATAPMAASPEGISRDARTTRSAGRAQREGGTRCVALSRPSTSPATGSSIGSATWRSGDDLDHVGGTDGSPIGSSVGGIKTVGCGGACVATRPERIRSTGRTRDRTDDEASVPRTSGQMTRPLPRTRAHRKRGPSARARPPDPGSQPRLPGTSGFERIGRDRPRRAFGWARPARAYRALR